MRKPISGAVWGLVLGIAIAILVQQQGIWPLDKLTVFLLPAGLGGIGVLLMSLGRSGSRQAMIVTLIVLVPLAAYGATGFGDIDEVGQLNGGCTVEATSAVDSTIVTDTSRSDPFDIDPAGSLSWKAGSGGNVFDDYPWRIYVDIGSQSVTIDEEPSENNDDGDIESSDSVSNVEEYGESRGIPVSQLRGIYKVGGYASVCDGFGFVRIISSPLETLAAQIATALALLALLMLIRSYLRSRQPASTPDANGGGGSGQSDGGGSEGPRSIATEIAAGAIAGGYAAPEVAKDELSDEDRKELVSSYLEADLEQEPPPPPGTGSTPGEQTAEPEGSEGQAEDPYEGLPGLEN